MTPLPATLYDIAVEEQRREMKDAAATTASPVASPSSTGMVTRRSGEKEKEKDVIVPKILSDYITQKKLTSCTSCPFSLCKDCEDTVDRVCGSCLSSSGSGDGIFRTKRHQVVSVYRIVRYIFLILIVFFSSFLFPGFTMCQLL